jgi:tripeptidyl-peptidase-1
LKGLYAGLYNKSKYNGFPLDNIADRSADGRGYSDISAQGLYFAFAWNHTFSSISGTSASTPLAASIILLVNDELVSCGRPPLGLLNPRLYYKGYKGFTDVISGYTSNCGTAAFPVTKGWDPVTGFGTPVCIFLFDQHAIANEFDRFSQSWWRSQSSVRFV